MKLWNWRQTVTVLAVGMTITVNALANILPINGQNTGEISDRFPVLFVPAGYVFSIWGLIYLGLVAFIIYQTQPSQRDNPRLQGIFWPFVVSNLANTVWIFLWHYNLFPLSLVAMLVLLASLVTIYLRLGIGIVPQSGAERWLVNLPFSIYLGWITVATIANAQDVLYDLGWNGAPLSAEAWALVMLAATFGVALLLSLLRRDVAYLLVIVWALVGIGVKQVAMPVVANAAYLTAGLVAVMALVTLFRNRNRHQAALPTPAR
jgi:translocator protein